MQAKCELPNRKIQIIFIQGSRAHLANYCTVRLRSLMSTIYCTCHCLFLSKFKNQQHDASFQLAALYA